MKAGSAPPQPHAGQGGCGVTQGALSCSGSAAIPADPADLPAQQPGPAPLASLHTPGPSCWELGARTGRAGFQHGENELGSVLAGLGGSRAEHSSILTIPPPRGP